MVPKKKLEEDVDDDDNDVQDGGDMLATKNVKKRPSGEGVRKRSKKWRRRICVSNKERVGGSQETREGSKADEVKAMEERKVDIEEEKLRVHGDEVNTKKMEQELKIML